MHHFNANLSADERERLAYLSGDPCMMAMAAALEESAELESRLDGIAEHGIYDATAAAALNGDLETERKAREDAEERVQELEQVLEVLQVALEPSGVRWVKATRERIAAALESVIIGAGYSGKAADYVRGAIHGRT